MPSDKKMTQMLSELMRGSALEVRKIGDSPDGAEEKACLNRLVEISRQKLASSKKRAVLTLGVEDDNGIFHLFAYMAVPSRRDAEMAAQAIAPAQVAAAILMEESQAKTKEDSESDGEKPSHEGEPFVATFRA